MPAISLPMLAQMSVERLLNCLGEGMVIAGFAWTLLRLLGRKNSGTRFAVWFSALVAIAVSPARRADGPTARVAFGSRTLRRGGFLR